MPKASVREQDRAPTRENEIGFSGEIFAMEPETKAKGVEPVP